MTYDKKKETVLEILIEQLPLIGEKSSVEDFVDVSDLTDMLTLNMDRLSATANSYTGYDVGDDEYALDTVLECEEVDVYVSCLDMQNNYFEIICEKANWLTDDFYLDLNMWVVNGGHEDVEDYLNEYGYHDEGYFDMIKSAQYMALVAFMNGLVDCWVDLGIEIVAETAEN